MDAVRELLVDLEDLADEAVLPVGRIRASVLERQAVLEDPLACRFRSRDELLRADDEDDVGRAPGIGGELATGGRSNEKSSLAGDCVDAAEGEVGLAADLLHLLQLRCEVELVQLVAR